MEKAKELINQIYLEVKKHYPDFEWRKYDTSETVYFGQTSRNYPGMNGNGFKFYKEFGTFKVGVKSNLKTGKLDDNIFYLPEQFEKARNCIFALYEIPINRTSVIDSAIKDFDAALKGDGIYLDASTSTKGTTTRFISKYDSSYAPVIITCPQDYPNKAVLKIKKYVPFDSDKNKDQFGCDEFDLLKAKNSRFIDPVEKIHILFETIELYNLVIKSPVFSTIKEIAIGYSIKLIDFYGENLECKLVFSKGYELTILKSKGRTIIRAKDRITGETKDSEFTEDGAFEAFNFLLQYQQVQTVAPSNSKKDELILSDNKKEINVGEATIIEAAANGQIVWSTDNSNIATVDSKGNVTGVGPGCCRITAKNGSAIQFCDITVKKAVLLPPLSTKALLFIEQVSGMKLDISDDELRLLFEEYDELDDDECSDERVKKSYESLKRLSMNENPVPQSVRFVYASKSFLKEIENLETEFVEDLEKIKKSFNTCSSNELSSFLISKRLVYIDTYLKIRVKNGDKHRIIFCFGDVIGKNPKDIYVFEYNRTHDFGNIKNLHPEEQQYSLWALEKPKVMIPPLTKKQEAISFSVDKPLICTGCAGSVCTLTSPPHIKALRGQVPERDLMIMTSKMAANH